MMIHTLTEILYEQSWTYLAEILPLAHAAGVCASLTDNSTTFGILEPGTLHGMYLSVGFFHPRCLVRAQNLLVLADSWLVSLSS